MCWIILKKGKTYNINQGNVVSTGTAQTTNLSHLALVFKLKLLVTVRGNASSESHTINKLTIQFLKIQFHYWTRLSKMWSNVIFLKLSRSIIKKAESYLSQIINLCDSILHDILSSIARHIEKALQLFIIIIIEVSSLLLLL